MSEVKQQDVSPPVLKPGEVTVGKVVVATGTVKPSITPPAKILSTLAPAGGTVKTNLQAAVNRVAAPLAQRPKSMKSGNTNNLIDQSFFRCVLYAETSARKTTTAAHFGSPEDVKIILTRSEDQMIPLEGEGYQYEYCPDAASLTYAMKYPEQVWPEWGKRGDEGRKKTLIVDDLTKAVSFLIEANSTGKDKRQAYTGALSDLDSLVIPLTRKPYNLILVSLAKVRENQISGEEMVGPDLSPSLLNYVTAEFAAVLYIQTKNFKLLTDRSRFTVMGTDPQTGKDKPFTREIFGKVKIPFHAVGKGIVKMEEELDLQALWKKIQSTHKGQGGKK